MITGGLIALTGKIIALNGGNKSGNLLIIIGFALNALLLFIGNRTKSSGILTKNDITSK